MGGCFKLPLRSVANGTGAPTKKIRICLQSSTITRSYRLFYSRTVAIYGYNQLLDFFRNFVVSVPFFTLATRKMSTRSFSCRWLLHFCPFNTCHVTSGFHDFRGKWNEEEADQKRKMNGRNAEGEKGVCVVPLLSDDKSNGSTFVSFDFLWGNRSGPSGRGQLKGRRRSNR